MQESYLTSMESRRELDDIETMALSSEYMSLGDALNRQLRINQDWSLLPDVGICSSVAPSILIKGRCHYPGFP
jgi:hypothetical protein